MAKRKNVPLKLCPAAEKIISEIPPFVGVTGDALRWVVKRCVRAQRNHDAKQRSRTT